MIAEKFLNRHFDDLVTVAKGVKRGLTTRHMALTPQVFHPKDIKARIVEPMTP